MISFMSGIGPISSGIGSAFDSGVAGLNAASSQLERSASATANEVSDPSSDPVANAVGLISASTEFAANLSTIKTADDLLGTIINIHA